MTSPVPRNLRRPWLSAGAFFAATLMFAWTAWQADTLWPEEAGARAGFALLLCALCLVRFLINARRCLATGETPDE